MKKHYLITIITLCLISFGHTQCRNNTTNNDKFNLDFERINSKIPIGWANNKNYASSYLFSLDSLNTFSGKYSISLEHNTGEIGFSSWSLIIPESYKGKRLTLSGYIKTENIQRGYAGFWIRLDPNGALNNMSAKGIKGTTEWTEHSITLTLNPEATERIVIGCILQGTGKAWFDNLSIKIDGKGINDLKPITQHFPALDDNEFEDGSNISKIELNKYNIENLRQLSLIWGFVKYNHPAVAMGNYNMDFELFRVLPRIIDAKTKEQRSDIILQWINDLGKIGDTPPSHILPKWISENNFSSELVALLSKIKNTEKSYYISKKPLGNPSFDHENRYDKMEYPDMGYRVLALFRYWNIIEYFYLYKPSDWDAVLVEFIPKFIHAKDKNEYNLTMLEMIVRIQDTHAQLYSSTSIFSDIFGNRQASPVITFIEDTPVVTGFMYNNPLHIGDIILSIDKKTIKDIVAEKLPYTSASNYTTQLRNIASELMKSNNRWIDVEYLRDGNLAKSRIPTYSQDSVKRVFSFNEPDTCFLKVTKNTSYLYLGRYKSSYIANLWSEINSSEGLIIDLRCYPAEFVTHSLGSLFFSKPTPFCKATTIDIKQPGLFTDSTPESIGRVNPFAYKGKLIILINEVTQSQAEFTAMALKAVPNAVIIGSTTAGADGDISTINLPGGLTTMISGIGIFYPDGKETQRIGIIPDIKVKPTIEGIKAGRDELLEKAITIINQDK